jgi:hypothetical protein
VLINTVCHPDPIYSRGDGGVGRSFSKFSDRIVPADLERTNLEKDFLTTGPVFSENLVIGLK